MNTQRIGSRTYQRYKIPDILKPRLTWKYLLCSAAAAYVAYCFVLNMPLFHHRLPEYTGPYPVGTIDIEAAAESPRRINDAKLKHSDQYAFQFDTVLFSLYYPASKVKSSRPRHYWIPKPLEVTAEGYAKFARIDNFITKKILTGMMGMMVGSLQIPARVDVGLAHDAPTVTPSSHRGAGDSQETLVETEEGGYPVIVFTHGMASSRTDYTQYCGELASRGYIVAAIEHRDGSSPGTIIEKEGHADKKLLHFGFRDIDSSEVTDVAKFKEAQLAFRQAEIEETVRVLQAINNGHGKGVFKHNSRNEGSDLKRWTHRLNTKQMILGGHSYGATGALQALRNGPSKSLPFIGAIILDPGKSSGSLNSDISVPILIVHSNSWSSHHSIFEGRPHFDVVRDIALQNKARGNPSWFMTSLGTSHPSITDAPLIEPLLLSWTTGAKIDVNEGLRQYVHVSNDFLHFIKSGEKRGLIREKANWPQYSEKNAFGQYKGQGDGWKKFWQVHVAPDGPVEKWTSRM